MEVTIRAHEQRDAADLAEVFFRSVRQVAISDYTPAQVSAWAPERRTAEWSHQWARRATAGVSGRSRLRPAEITVMAAAWLGVFAVMGALAGAGVSKAVVYGTYPATVPLMAAGLAWAGIMAARAS